MSHFKIAVKNYVYQRRWIFAAWAALCVLVAVFGFGGDYDTDDGSLSRLFSNESFVDAKNFKWVEDSKPGTEGALKWHPGVFLARPAPGGPHDVFAAEFRRTSRERIRACRRLTNITRSAEGDELGIVGDGKTRIAFATRSSGKIKTVSILDFAGEREDLVANWPWWLRVANKITNYQKTGRLRGIHWENLIFTDPPASTDLSFENGIPRVCVRNACFKVDSDDKKLGVPFVLQRMVKAPPAFLAWAVDTARAIPWIGADRIAWLEQRWFRFRDWCARTRYSLSWQKDAGFERPGISDIESGERMLSDWPPPAIEPVLKRPVAGEGTWYPVDDPGFLPENRGPGLFYTSAIRVDPERPFARVHLVAWNPDYVELRMMAGVIEPISTTGLRGAGEVPRGEDRDHVSRMIGAFNGAFQALHGEWGMMVAGQVFLPPKPFGATVAVMDDGRVGMGTWPNPGDAIPEGMVEFRQNLLPLVEKQKINPYGLKWWGAAPPGVEERIFTLRTGLCLTVAGKMIYFWAPHASAETLGEAMLRASCDFGMHLDMNSGHSGFEFYRVDEKGSRPPLNREPIPDLEAEGDVPGRGDLVFRARKMVDEMAHMRFPRYIGRDPRDFFYLLKKPSIFDAPPTGSKGWRPMGAGRPGPVAAVSAVLPGAGESGGAIRLSRVDPVNVVFSIQENPPKDSLLAIPLSPVGNGFSVGMKSNGKILAPFQPGLPIIGLGKGETRVLDAGEEPMGEVAIQGMPKTAAARVPFSSVLTVDRAGFLVVAQSELGGTDALFAELDKMGDAPALALLSPNPDARETFWLVAMVEAQSTWYRINKKAVPVGPEVWREVYRKRGRSLRDHAGNTVVHE